MKSVDYFVCCICRYEIDQALFISWRYLIRCPANEIALHIAQLLCYCKKDNLCSLLDSGKQIFLLVKIKGPGKRGHIVADTLLSRMYLGLRKLGNISQQCCVRGQTGKHLCQQQCVLVCQGLNSAKVHESSREFGGGTLAPFPKHVQRLVIEPKTIRLLILLLSLGKFLVFSPRFDLGRGTVNTSI